MRGADLVAEVLARHGVTFVSALVGNGINPVLYSCRQRGMRVIDTRNEQTASYMAEGYGRLTGRVGVCAVSSSVGVTNAMIGVVNAWFDGAPMLLLGGATDHACTDHGKFQDFDQVALAQPAVKYARLVDRPEKIPFYLHEALAHATAGRPGPVHLTIPQDVLLAECSAPASLDWPADAALVRPAAAGTDAAVAAAARLIAGAERPLLVAGSGVYYAHGEQALAQCAARSAMPIVTPIWDRGSVPQPIPQFMGVIGSASGSPDLLAAADVIVLAGAQVDYRVSYLQPPAVRPDARIVRIDVDPLQLRQEIDPHVAVQGDPATVLAQITGLLPARPSAAQVAWLEEARRRERSFRGRWLSREAGDRSPFTGQDVVEAIRPFVQGDAALVVDGGNIGQWAHMLLSERYPGHWLTCGASGVVGYGIGGAMAARMAYPERPVILLSGDGSIGFNLPDLESATRQGLPFVCIVADDSAWGITLSGQQREHAGEESVACLLSAVRYDVVAQGLGAYGVTARTPQELAAAIELGLRQDRPTLIHVPIAHVGPAD